MKLDLVDKLVEDRLILQEARKEKIAVNEGLIKSRVAQMKKRYPSEADFNAILAKQGLVQADIETKMREQFMMRSIVEAKVKPRVTISPNEVTDFYQKNKEKFALPEQRELTVIDFKNKVIAEEVYNDLKAGQAIDELNAKYSLNIDSITVMQEGRLRKDIEERIFRLEPGGITAPLEVENTYYIFKLDNIIAPRQQNLSEVQDEIHNFLGNQKMQEELVKWIDELKAKAYIKILQS
jgi:foldase protein PrsA